MLDVEPARNALKRVRCEFKHLVYSSLMLTQGTMHGRQSVAGQKAATA
jgi:hypothetical protein